MNRLDRAAAAFERFLFAPQPVSTVALVRIAYGVLLVSWTTSLAADLDAFFTPGGVMPAAPDGALRWGLLELVDSSAAVYVAWALLLASAVALLVGWHSRIAAAIAFVLLTSFEQRNPFVFNAGDALIRIIAFYLVLAPAGAALSFSRRRAEPGAPVFPERAPWALRLVQLQLSVIYLASVIEKLRGHTWRDGSALAYALQLDDYQRFSPDWLTASPVVGALATWGTLIVELSVGVLVWNRRLRPYVLVAGAALHVAIALTIRVGYFSAAMLVLYVAFVPPEMAARLLAPERWREKIPPFFRRLV